MELKSMVLALYPYWLLGLFVIWATVRSGYGNLVRLEKAAVLKFMKFILFVTLWRAFIFTVFASHFVEQAKIITQIPTVLTLGVWWEDALHGLPILLFSLVFASKKWVKPAYYLILATIMFEFGLGHVYQGLISAIMLSFYIPYSIYAARKFGFGTVMACHVIYDLTTILSLKFLLGA